MNGKEVYKKLREKDPSTKVILMTGFSKMNEKLEMETLGINEVLHNPFSLDTLLIKLNQIL